MNKYPIKLGNKVIIKKSNVEKENPISAFSPNALKLIMAIYSLNPSPDIVIGIFPMSTIISHVNAMYGFAPLLKAFSIITARIMFIK